jgi:hypothetical protein
MPNKDDFGYNPFLDYKEDDEDVAEGGAATAGAA